MHDYRVTNPATSEAAVVSLAQLVARIERVLVASDFIITEEAVALAIELRPAITAARAVWAHGALSHVVALGMGLRYGKLGALLERSVVLGQTSGMRNAIAA